MMFQPDCSRSDNGKRERERNMHNQGSTGSAVARDKSAKKSRNGRCSCANIPLFREGGKEPVEGASEAGDRQAFQK